MRGRPLVGVAVAVVLQAGAAVAVALLAPLDPAGLREAVRRAGPLAPRSCSWWWSGWPRG